MKPRTIFVCILALLVFPLSVSAKSKLLEWDPKKVEQVLGLGASPHITVDLRAFKRFEDVCLWVVPELKNLVQIDTTPFTIETGETKTFELTISALNSGSFDGTIHVKSGRKTIPATLKIGITIHDALGAVGNEGGIIRSLDNKFALEIPEQALPSEELIIVNEILNPSFQRIYDIQPDGLTFMKKVQLTVAYDPTYLSSGINETEQYIAILNDNFEIVEVLNDSVVDTTNHNVNATSIHFSNFAIATPANGSSATPPAASEFLKFKIPVNNAPPPPPGAIALKLL